MQPQIAERHFLDLRKMYGSVLAVDLLNKVSSGWLMISSMQLDFIVATNIKFSY